MEGETTLRIWPWQLLPYLPDRQFRGQLRELVATLHDWRDKGKTNHLLINVVMEYPKSDFIRYYSLYADEYRNRYGKDIKYNITKQFIDFCFDRDYKYVEEPFGNWHGKPYLRICMANLMEKHMGIGSSRVTDEEWKRLCDGYKTITGEEYML